MGSATVAWTHDKEDYIGHTGHTATHHKSEQDQIKEYNSRLVKDRKEARDLIRAPEPQPFVYRTRRPRTRNPGCQSVKSWARMKKPMQK